MNKKMRTPFALVLCGAASLWPAFATDIIQPALDGMILELKPDVLQQVDIRVQSFGPGLCQVTVTLAGSTHSLAAPPLTWSNWFPIGPGLSGGAHSLGFSPGCDTGAQGQVRYEKKEEKQ
jgi:hypothetical protein